MTTDTNRGGASRLRYTFYTYKVGLAEVGLANRGTFLAVHLPSSGGSTNGHRNPGRSDLFKRLMGELRISYPNAEVTECRFGRSDTPVRVVDAQVGKGGVEVLEEVFREGGNFRFDCWLRLDDEQSPATVAAALGLVEGVDRRIEVLWPSDRVSPSVRPNAWLLGATAEASRFSVKLDLNARLAGGIRGGDAVVVLDRGRVARFGRIYRKRGDANHTTLYLDGAVEPSAQAEAAELGLPESVEGPIRRLEWSAFEAALRDGAGISYDQLPVLTGETNAEKAYLRELLQLATVDDLLGPANGPEEDIVGMGVRDRYLVGKLAPREPAQAPAASSDRTELLEEDDVVDGDVPVDLKPLAEVGEGREKAARRRLPGEEFPTVSGGSDTEEETDLDLSASKNQSFIPSSIGLTVCVDRSADEIEIEARWGEYARFYDHEHFRYQAKVVVDDALTPESNEMRRLERFRTSRGRLDRAGLLEAIDPAFHDAVHKALERWEEEELEDGDAYFLKCTRAKERVWIRRQAGGVFRIQLREGLFGPISPDDNAPNVVLQGTVRAPLHSGDRLVTLFLVNNQQAPKTSQDAAWVFQPEIVVRHPSKKPVFRRRPVPLDAGTEDFSEEDALEMIYRRRIEFGVGHSVSVHAQLAPSETEHAAEVRTSVIPQYEVAVTETPGLDPNDRPAMRRMVAEGFLDMTNLAGMPRPELLAALRVLTDDYAAWIEEQRGRLGVDVVGHDAAANAALSRCTVVLKRLLAGLEVLETDDLALEAFRFANRAMATQRLRSIYSLLRRRGQKTKYADLDVRKNRSWRPFQLAFVLLSIPALNDPTHDDRTNPVDGIADLIWFPTGGGKTEAYLGVAAFTMAIRRLKSSLGGLDGSRGLSVIMRYTLRLLTLQQFQRASTLICAMEVLRRDDPDTYGATPFSIGLWVGSKVTPNSTEAAHAAVEAERTGKRAKDPGTPAQLTSCPWCGSEIVPGKDIEVRRFKSGDGRTVLYCGDKLGRCEFSRARSKVHGLPVVVVDEELYRRPPSMLIATVDKFAMMAWKGAVRTLFGRAEAECPRHGLLWPGPECGGSHQKYGGMPAVSRQSVTPLRPPDLIIQDEFHLISGPLGTMVGLYETAVDELACWKLGGHEVRPKVIASTATVRRAADQVNNVFLRRVGIFPPHGLDIEDNFFSVQRPIEEKPGRRYMGICAPGSARPAVLIRLYTALLTAGQELFGHFGAAVDPWMTVVGYFNSLRELGGMRRLAEDDVQTRCYRVQMSSVRRPGLAQRNVRVVDELTSRVSGKDIPKKLDQLEVPFRAAKDQKTGRWMTPWKKGDTRPMDVVLATNMLSVGVDVNRIGLMAVNGQPKNTAEYIQATSRVGRAFPGLVCTVLTWSRPRDLSHYETFEHYHATFYRHVEAQSVTPFAPRALDRGLTGTMVSWLRLSHDEYNPNLGAGEMTGSGRPEVGAAKSVMSERAYRVTDRKAIKELTTDMVAQRCDEWVKEANKGGRRLGYQSGRARKQGQDDVAGLLKRPGLQAWDRFTVPMSLREVEPGARLVMLDDTLDEGPEWEFAVVEENAGGEQ